MSFRAWRSWAPAALAVLALSCARKHPPKLQHVAFWVSWPVSAIEPLARRFEAETPGIQVDLVQLPWTGVLDSVAAAARAGAPPDLLQLHDWQLPPFLAAGSLSDWSAGVADLRAGLRGWDMCMLGDAIYGLPWLLRARVLYWNKRLLAEAGLDSARAPGTWDELRAAAAKVQHLRGGGHGFGMPDAPPEGPLALLMPFAWGDGGELFSAGLDSSRFDSPGTIAALEFLHSLRPVALVASEDSLAAEFAAGRLGLVLASSLLATQLAHSAPALRYGMALVPRPAPDRGTNSSLAGGEVLASLTASHRKEDALKLARFLVRPENAHALATALQCVQPANRGADTTAWYRARPEQLLLFRQYESARFLPNLRIRMALEDTLRTLVGEALQGERTAVEAVAMADSFITRQLGPR